MARKREDMVSDLVDSYTTRELKALVKMLGASDPWDMYPIDLVASAIKAEFFDPALFRKEKLARELTMLESTCDDDETALFILWASETSRTTQDMVSTFMGWCANHGYTCHDDLPEEMQKYEGGI